MIMPSTAIGKYYYETDASALIVVFVSGKVYKYKHVPEKIYLQMKSSLSKGTFLNKYIKGHYDFEEIKE